MNKPLCVGELVEKAGESLEAAGDLQAKAHYGFAASRAYYAMFYAAEAALLHKELQFKKHSAVHAYFNKLFVKTGVFPHEMFDWLKGASDLRTVGDYSTVRVREKDAARAIANAEEFIAAVRKYLRREGYELGESWNGGTGDNR